MKMTDKKLTDEDIISSLEVISTTGNCNECKIRNCKWGTCNCSQTTADAALDLINRQKSELSNTRRKALLEAASKFAGHSNYHGDTILCKLICMAEGKDVGIAKPLDISEMKAEAVKEFADKLKERIYKGGVHPTVENEFMCDIDNLLKEMVGEEE